MSKRNILVAFILGATMFAGSAAADGKNKRIIKDGPCPIHTVKTKGGKCIPRVTTPPKYCPSGFVKTTDGKCIRRQVPPPTKISCPQGYYKTNTGRCVPPAPKPPKPSCPAGYRQTATGCALIQREVKLDIGSFNGGVGAGINGGYYGGGGFVAVGSSRSFSGVLDASASVFTFNREVKKRSHPKPCNRGCGGHPKPPPPPKPCMGGCGGKG